MNSLSKNQESSILVVCEALNASGVTPLRNLILILNGTTPSVDVLTDSKKFDISGVYWHIIKPLNIPIIQFLYYQIFVTIYILMFRKKNRKIIFFIGGDILFLPLLAARFFKLRTYILLAGNSEKVIKITNGRNANFVKLLKKLCFIIAHNILMYSPGAVVDNGCERFVQKIKYISEHWIDVTVFKKLISYEKRKKIIGYVGRLSPEKGVLNFLYSIPLILKSYPSMKFYIIGDGALGSIIELYINEHNLNDHVFVYGWLNKNELVKLYNDMKLLIIPSYTEGFPNVILESFCCGTPIITTLVGSISELIPKANLKMALSNNNSYTIANMVISYIDNNELLIKLSNDNLKYVVNNYSFDVVLSKWSHILNE